MTIGTKIIAIEYETASSVVKNDDLTRILDTSDEWIVSRTGIKQRKIISGDTSSTDLGIAAARKVIENSGYNPNDIDLIIAASS
ncbi:3-oxoacyl-ACP synthase, partial [bacterium]|nr:3-oxoacyl-ACP synthase [bacterium]